MSYKLDSRVIGQTIKSLRLSRNWTQDHLADVVGYSVRNLRRIENDGTSSIDIVNTFAEVFNVSAIDILSGGCLLFTKKSQLLIRCDHLFQLINWYFVKIEPLRVFFISSHIDFFHSLFDNPWSVSLINDNDFESISSHFFMPEVWVVVHPLICIRNRIFHSKSPLFC